MPDVLTLRQLNRATLARQMLLDRVQMPAYDLVHHLVGLQAQEPQDPYIGLWSRITDFDTAELEGLLLDRKVVRLTVQRGTVHAVTADDCLVLRPLAMPILAQQLNNHRDHRGKFDGVDLDAVMAFAGEVLGESPLNTRQLRAALAERFPEHDAAALTFACRNRLAFVQLPPRGLWSRGGQVVGTTAEAWLGRPLETEPSVADVMRRYLGAFGPATVRDAATWSRYTGLREVFEQLGPELRTYRDDTGKEYFDVPDGPLPDPDAPAPVRLLPQYDNVLLSHADRTRIVGGFDYSNIWMERTGFLGSVLVDGKLAGMWRFDRPLRSVINATEPATLTFRTRPLRAGEEDDVGAEAQRFLRFVSPGVDHNVRFEVVE
jgi:DNA glycosylase AlkZ-like